jgi:hypothetical protein
MAEYSRMAKGSFTAASGQTSAAVQLPFVPDRVEVFNLTNIAAGPPSSAAAILKAYVDFAAPTVGSSPASTMVEMYNGAGTGVYVTDSIANPNGISTVQAGLALQYGPAVNIVVPSTSGSVAKTNSTTITVTVAAGHGLNSGNWVIFQNLYQTATTGMQQICGIPFMVTVTSSTVFTISWVGNSSDLTAITNACTGVPTFKQILYPVLYAPGVAFPWTITQAGNVITVDTTAPHNFRVGQEIAFRIPSQYGATQLNSLPDVLIPGSPLYFYVASVPSSTSFTVNSGISFTAFTVNQPFSSFPGLPFAQVVAVGDVNSGGYPYTGGALYPSPYTYNGYSLNSVTTINGPAIHGAYINATWQGFVINAGLPQTVGAGTIVTSSSVIAWRAFLDDYSNP